MSNRAARCRGRASSDGHRLTGDDRAAGLEQAGGEGGRSAPCEPPSANGHPTAWPDAASMTAERRAQRPVEREERVGGAAAEQGRAHVGRERPGHPRRGWRGAQPERGHRQRMTGDAQKRLQHGRDHGLPMAHGATDQPAPGPAVRAPALRPSGRASGAAAPPVRRPADGPGRRRGGRSAHRSVRGRARRTRATPRRTCAPSRSGRGRSPAGSTPRCGSLRRPCRPASNNVTLRPASAMRNAATSPFGPPPMTTASTAAPVTPTPGAVGHQARTSVPRPTTCDSRPPRAVAAISCARGRRRG